MRAKPLRLLGRAGLSVVLVSLLGGVAPRQSTARTAPAALTSIATAAPAEATPLYGIAGPPPAGLVRVNLRTMRRLPGWRIPLDGHSFGWSFSPDRSRLALGSDGSGEVRLVDLRHRRVLGDVELKTPQRGSVLASAWTGANRVLAVVVSPGCCGLGNTTVAGIRAARPRLLWQRRLGGSLQAGARFRRSLVLVLGPPGRRLGPSRLVTVDPDGHVRSAALSEIRRASADPATSAPADSSPISGIPASLSTQSAHAPSSSRPARRSPRSTCAACGCATTRWPSRSRCSAGCTTGWSRGRGKGGRGADPTGALARRGHAGGHRFRRPRRRRTPRRPGRVGKPGRAEADRHPHLGRAHA